MNDHVTAPDSDRTLPATAIPALAVLPAAAERTAQLMREITDPRAPVPGLRWNAAEVAAHVVADLRTYTGVVAGRGPSVAPGTAPASELGTAENARQLAEYPERSLDRLAAELTTLMPAFIAAATAAPDGTVGSPVGVDMTPATLAAIILGEQLVHGLDLARAAGRDWPIDPADARLVIPGAVEMLPAYLNRDAADGLHTRYELRIGDLRYQLAVDDGTAAVGPASGRPDCVITADPVAFLLVGYGRIAPWGPMLRGQLRAGGRKPWLGFKFNRLTVSP
ncbi:MAG: maleylpyruvate isomerase family mycothiol-dependent enzyme [Actinobacteria bacterium]|nr:maleylpyruvate isomerase family mycothiol-dependent enzyme [Actinomycetota bacterium]